MTRPQARPRRLTGVAIAWLLLMGQLGGVVHHLTVTHGVCAAHGEAIHVDEHHVEHAHEASPVAEQVAIGAGAAAEHAHDHCDVQWCERDRAAVGPPEWREAPPLASGPLATPPVTAARATSVPVYVVAPKAGPPAAQV